MINKKYLFFIDIDDTLVPTGETQIRPEILEEIQRLKSLGHIFVISTGRALRNTLNLKGIEVFDYLSVLLGSCIYQMPDKRLLKISNPMPKAEVFKLVDYLNREKIDWSYKDETDTKTYFDKNKFFQYKERCHFVSPEEANADIENNHVMQLLVIGHLAEDVEKQFKCFDFFKMSAGYTDVAMKNSSKGICVDYFRKKYPDLTMVSIGDSSNDLAMFEKTDISIAMGNAKDEIKRKTTYTTKPLDDNGLIHAFREILKI